MLAILTPILLFTAFLLLLLISLSTPLIKSIFLFRLAAKASSSLLDASASGSVRFGVWGYCTSAINVSVVGITKNTNGAECSKPHLGFTFDSTVANALHVNGLTNLISRTLTAALVLHPIAAGLTFLTLLTSLASLLIIRRNSHSNNTSPSPSPSASQSQSRLPTLIPLSLTLTLLTALLTTIVFLIDVILVAVVRSRVHKDSDGDLSLVWGNAVWMALGASIALWAACVGGCAGVFACGPRRSRYRKGATTY